MNPIRFPRPRLLAIAAALVVAGALAGLAARPSGSAVAATAAPPTPTPVVVNGRVYDAYIPAANKQGQFYYYTCEFDAAWVVLKTFGHDVSLEEQLEIVGIDRSVEPYVQVSNGQYYILGGDIETAFSGDYTSNFLARSSGEAIKELFEHYRLAVTDVDDREGVEEALQRGELVWMKATVDFLPWEQATWITPDGDRFKTVLGNDHAVVAIGYNEDVVVIRDVLGPTDTNWSRTYEYEVDWDTFLRVWEAQDFDGLAVGPRRSAD